MVAQYPINVQRNSYRGSDPKKRRNIADMNLIATKLEQKINQLIETQKEPIRVYKYYEISRITGIDIETVRNICFSIDGGHGGFTVAKPGLSVNEALSLLENS